MPINIPKHLPAGELLKKEKIFVMEAIAAGLPETAKRMKLCIPYTEGSFLQLLREEGTIFSESYTENGVEIDVLVDIKRQKQASLYLLDT